MHGTKFSFSIIMPAYNEEKIISKSINSILLQDYEKFNLIIINDGSTDKTLEKISSFKDKRIVIVNKKKNEGYTKAVISGIKKAKGDIICIFDSDSIAPKNWLSRYHMEYDKTFDKDVGVIGGLYDPRGNFLTAKIERLYFKMISKIKGGMISGTNLTFKYKNFKNEFSFDEFSALKRGIDGYIKKKFLNLGYKNIALNNPVSSEFPKGWKNLALQWMRWGFGTFSKEKTLRGEGKKKGLILKDRFLNLIISISTLLLLPIILTASFLFWKLSIIVIIIIALSIILSYINYNFLIPMIFIQKYFCKFFWAWGYLFLRPKK